MTEQDVIFGDDEDENNSAAESASKTEEKTESGGSDVEGRYRISPLTLTVFKRETDNGTFRNYQLQRTYPKDDNGEDFGYTDSLRPRDLRKAARLFELAADDIQGLSKEEG